MSVGVRVGSIVDEVGSPSFFNAFFSTIAGRLEPAGAGTRFPVVSVDFYDGRVPADKVEEAIDELMRIREELASFPPTAVIWDIDDPEATPPWGDRISPDITSMANYFVSSTGRDLFELLLEAFDDAKRQNADVTIE
jgi:hypothetical protein